MAMIFPVLNEREVIAIDTETTGLGPLDKPVGASWARQDGSRDYISWGHEGGGNNATLGRFREWWQCEVLDKRVTTVLHNATFDMRMLQGIGVMMPGRFEDTGILAGLIDEHRASFSLDGLSRELLDGQQKEGDELYAYLALTFGGKPTREAQGGNIWRAPASLVAPYAAQDAHLTLQLYDVLRPGIAANSMERVYELETALQHVLVRMYRVGIRADRQIAQSSMEGLKHDQDEALAHLKRIAGREVNAQSSMQLAELLKTLDIDTPVTDKGNPSVTSEFLDTLDHPIGQVLRTARKARHYADVFLGKYILSNLTPKGTIHPNFHSVKSSHGGAKTGRFSSSGGLNAQNIPSRDEVLGPRVKGCFVPYYDGGQVGEIDFSQIEYRFFAHYAGGEVMRRYAQDPDVDYHAMVAKLTGLPRSKAKNINFGVLFGMGPKKMAESLGVSLSEARAVLDTYFARIPEAKRLASLAETKAAQRGYIITWGGRRCHFQVYGGRFGSTHKALNYVVQGSAADLIKTAMVEVDKVIDWKTTLIHLTIHDSLLFTFPPGEDGVREAKRIQEVMNNCATLRVPIRSSLKMGPTWGSTRALDP